MLQIVALMFLQFASAQDVPSVPVCEAFGSPIQNNNQQVLLWKHSTQNQYQNRALVSGAVTQIFPDRTGHQHFEIKIGPDAKDVLEVVYNAGFGDMPDPTVGTVVTACGDYITSYAQAGPYPPSPSGAIIHWIHMNPRGRGHDHGYVMQGLDLFGYDRDVVARLRERYGAPGARPGTGTNLFHFGPVPTAIFSNSNW